MVNFNALSKLSKPEQEGVIKNTPEFHFFTKTLSKWQSTKENEHLQNLLKLHPIVIKYGLRRYLQQRQISKEDAQHILEQL